MFKLCVIFFIFLLDAYVAVTEEEENVYTLLRSVLSKKGKYDKRSVTIIYRCKQDMKR
jgi:hypothetical protein